MRRTGVGVWLAVGLGVFGLLSVALPAVYFLTAYGCGRAEDRLAGVLAGEAVLDVAPGRGAERIETYSGCDDDDRFVTAGAVYRYDGPAQGVPGRYREAAQADGWRQQVTAAGGPEPGCFTKQLSGTTAYLFVEEVDGGVLTVEITADEQGSAWC